MDGERESSGELAKCITGLHRRFDTPVTPSALAILSAVSVYHYKNTVAFY